MINDRRRLASPESDRAFTGIIQEDALAEVAVLGDLFRRIFGMIADLRPGEPAPWRRLEASAQYRRQAKCARNILKRAGIAPREPTKAIGGVDHAAMAATVKNFRLLVGLKSGYYGGGQG